MKGTDMKAKNLIEIEAMAEALTVKHNSAVMGKGPEPEIHEFVAFVSAVKVRLMQMRGVEIPGFEQHGNDRGNE
jgi:hypothetical protein